MVLSKENDKNTTGITTPGQSGHGSRDNEGVHHRQQRSRTGASASDGLES